MNKPCISRGGVPTSMWLLVFLVFSFTTIASTTWAQTVASGTIHGAVKDEQGGTLPGVTVTLGSQGRGVRAERATQHDDQW